jgi:glycosyltransferase involved in cell wall biosynthesis
LTSGGYDSDFWKPGDKTQARRNLNLPLDVPIILSSSVLIPKKRLDDLIKAAAIVKEKVGNLQLIISGYGESSEKQRLLQITSQTNMQDYVIFTDYVTDSQLLSYYHAADVFVHLSEKEGGPTSCKQALATNIPVVMTPVGSVGKWIQESGMGRLFPVGDISACAKEILNVLQAQKHPDTTEFAYKLWSWDARGTTMAKDIEQLWGSRKEFK